MHVDLTDLDQMMGAPRAAETVTNEKLDVSAHTLAASAADIWEMTPLQTKDGFGRVQGDLWFTTDWSFMEVDLPPALFKMDERHAQDDGVHVVIERWLSGEERGNAADGVYVSGPGELHFLDQHCPFESVTSQRRMQSISLPRELLGLCEERPVVLPAIHQSSAIGQLAFAEWDDLYADLKRGDARLSTAKMDRTIACLKIALGVNPQREDVRSLARDALFRHICRFIELNLENTRLSSKVLLDQFGVSRATLYRMFEPLGGVRQYLTYRRAMRALQFILDGGNRRGLVNEACERFGFSSPANFNRTIQRLFGNSPKALLAGVLNPKPGPLSLDYFFQFTYQGETGSIPGLSFA